MKLKLSFRKLKKYIEERLSRRKYTSGRGNFSFYKPRSKELAQKNIFYFVVLGFKVETFWLESHLTKCIKRHSITLKFARLWYLFACYLDLVQQKFLGFFTHKINLKKKTVFAKMVVM